MPKYTIVFNKGMEKLLATLSLKKGISQAKVLRRALIHYAYLVKLERKGKKVYVVDSDGKILRNIKIE